MKHELFNTNLIPVKEGMKRVIMSIDIVNMYPRLNKEVVKEELFKLVVNSSIEIKNLNVKMLTIYLSMNVNKDRLKKMGLESVILTRKPDRKNKNNEESFEWKNNNRNEKQVRNMMGLMCELLIDFIMTSHCYMVGDKIILKLLGGPIGLEITRIIARIMMLIFDLRFKKMLLSSTP